MGAQTSSPVFVLFNATTHDVWGIFHSRAAALDAVHAHLLPSWQRQQRMLGQSAKSPHPFHLLRVPTDQVLRSRDGRDTATLQMLMARAMGKLETLGQADQRLRQKKKKKKSTKQTSTL